MERPDLITKANGEVKNCIENIKIILKSEYKCEYNELRQEHYVDNIRIDDQLMRKLRDDIFKEYGFKPRASVFCDELFTECEKNRFHPILDKFKTFHWDNQNRVETVFIDYANAEDNKYIREVTKLLFVAAVRRLKQPGCKFDIMVILEGEQGSSKSTFFDTMSMNSDWFTDDFSFDLDSKCAMEQTKGKWIVEAGDLVGLNKREVNKVKSYLSRKIDISRMAYGRIVTERPRQFIIVGTTNDSVYLRDYTGNRRFYPVKTGKMNYKDLKENIEQIWAEAIELEKTYGENLWNEDIFKLAAKEQEKRLEIDSWEDILSEQLDGFKEGKISNANLWRLLGSDRGGSGRLVKIMKRLGWKNTTFYSSLKKQKIRGYVKNPKMKTNKELSELSYNERFNKVIRMLVTKMSGMSIDKIKGLK